MTIYRIQAPNGDILRIEGPEGVSQEEIMAYAESAWQPPAPKEEAIDKDVRRFQEAKAAKEKADAAERTWGEFAGDTARSLTQGAIDATAGVGGFLYGAATGDYDNTSSEFARGMNEVLQEGKSAKARLQGEAVQKAMAAADGGWEKAAVGGWETLKNPTMLADQVARSLPGMYAGSIVGRGATAVTQGVGNAMLRAAPDVASKMATTGLKVGTVAPQVAGPVAEAVAALTQGSSVAGDTYEEAMKVPIEVYAQQEGFKKLADKVGAEEAKRVMASDATTRAGVMGSLASALSMRAIPGGNAIERMFVPKVAGEAAEAAGKTMLTKPLTKGFAGGIASKAGEVAIKGTAVGASEALSESAEEGLGAVAQALEVSRITGEVPDLGAVFAESAGQAMPAGFFMGKVTGMRSDAPEAPPPAPKVEDQSTTPQAPAPKAPTTSAQSILEREAALDGETNDTQAPKAEQTEAQGQEAPIIQPPIKTDNSAPAQPASDAGQGAGGSQPTQVLPSVTDPRSTLAAEMEAIKARASGATTTANTAQAATENVSEPGQQEMADEFERLYQQDVKAAIQERLGLTPKATTNTAQAAKPVASPFRSFLREVGISSSLAADITGARGLKANNALPATFRKNGRNLDDLASLAVERGFLSQSDIDSADDNGGTNKLVQMIQAEIRGERQQSADRASESAEQAHERVQRLEIEGAADSLGLQYSPDTSTDALATMVSRVQRRIDQANAPKGTTKAYRVQKMAIAAAQRIEQRRAAEAQRDSEYAALHIAEQNAYIDVLFDEDGTPIIVNKRAIDAELAAQQMAGKWSYQNEGQTTAARDQGTGQNPRETGPPVAGIQNQGAGDAVQERGQAQRDGEAGTEEGLSSYTPAQLQERESATKQAQAQSERQQRDIEQRAQADAQRDEFTLTGSDRAADANPGQEGLKFSFAGRNAATANIGTLEQAQQRTQSGEDAETVRQETGWHKGVDGAWRFEISDKGALLKAELDGPNKGKTIGRLFPTDDYQTVGSVLHHPELFAAYPDLESVPIKFVSEIVNPGIKGSFGKDGLSLSQDLSPEEARSTILHELQHAIQDREGFATGGSPTNATGYEAQVNSELVDLLQTDRQLDTAYQKWASYQRDMEAGREFSAADAETAEAELLAMPGGKQVIDLHSTLDGLADPSSAPIVMRDRYRRLGGEVEARNTQARAGMNEAKRRVTPPSQTQDVADAEQIVRRGSGRSEFAPRNLNRDVTLTIPIEGGGTAKMTVNAQSYIDQLNKRQQALEMVKECMV